MEIYKLPDMTKGWFVGGFEPTALHTNDCEVAVKHYKMGDREETHVHRIATEITVIVSGQVIMGNKFFSEGDIIKILPGEFTNFMAVEDTTTVCVKTPSVKGDKYVN